MEATVLIDELHVTVRVPNDLPSSAVDAVRDAVRTAEFIDRVRQAVWEALGTFPELSAVRLSVTR